LTRTVLLAGGGTGGHVYPLVAVADALRRVDPALRIVFVGTERGIEKQVVPERGYELELAQVLPIRGMGVGGAMRGVWGAVSCLPSSFELLRRLRPAVVLTVGGYAAGPVSAVTRLRRIPLGLLEPNAVIGLSNRVIAPFVDRAYTAFPLAERHFAPAKVLRSGVPIRDGFEPSPWRPEARPQRVLVLGGSQGARTLNENVPSALARQQVAVVVRHQCGTSDVEMVKQRYVAAGLPHASVESFIDDMPSALRDADLVISRSGASAVSEICAVGRASLLVPYPYAAGNHQQRNAESLAEAGAARWVNNRDATSSQLTDAIAALLRDPNRVAKMADMARSIGRPQAAARIAEDLLALAGLGRPEPGNGLRPRETN
jgi:UDP-N-acetylglucosamine--N-acetylmuramyl-(pentapeptide) pyrophosphoryl-undecaprenol N-acetylglucosamine transferase